VGNVLGICRKIRVEGERCEISPVATNGVFRTMCPCAEELVCTANDGIVGNLIGTCQM